MSDASDVDRLTKREQDNLKIKDKVIFFHLHTRLGHHIKSEGHIHQSEQLAPGYSPHQFNRLTPPSEDGHLLFDGRRNTGPGTTWKRTAFAVCGAP